jgi:polyhydroxybutyrate depolymerase
VPFARPSRGCAAPATAPVDAVAPHTITIGGTARTYRLSVPRRAGSVPVPLILLLHGLGSSADDVIRASDLPERARLRGMAVVTPNALGAPALWQMGAANADAAFLDALVSDVEARQCIDRARVAVVGFSAGAAFGNAYACARQDKIDAVATVSVEFGGSCTQPMPYLAFHGTADPIVAYGATAGNLQRWAATGRCGDPVTTELDAQVTRTDWSRCAPGVSVVLYAITGGVREWPRAGLDFSGGRDKSPRSASDTIVQFLERRHL